MTSPIRPDDLDLLSSYLDNALPEAARANLEARLSAEPELRATLDSLRTTVRVLRAAPALRPPRNFTLDPARYRRRTPWWASYRAMQTVGALGALVSAVLIVVGIFSSTLLGVQSVPAPASGAIAVLPTSNVTTQSGRFESTPTLGQRASDKAAAPATQTNEIVGQDALSASQAAPTVTTLAAVPTLPPTVAAASLFSATGVVPPSSADETAAGLSAAQPPQQTALAEEYRTTVAVAGAAAAQAPTATQQILKSQGDNQNAQSPGPAQPGEVAPFAATSQPQPSVLQATALPSATVTSTPSPAPTTTRVPATTTLQATSVIALDVTATLIAEQGGAGGKVEPSVAATLTLASGLRDNKDDNVHRNDITRPFAAPAYFLIIGIALFIFSVMLFGIGWLRSRL